MVSLVSLGQKKKEKRKKKEEVNVFFSSNAKRSWKTRAYKVSGVWLLEARLALGCLELLDRRVSFKLLNFVAIHELEDALCQCIPCNKILFGNLV